MTPLPHRWSCCSKDESSGQFKLSKHVGTLYQIDKSEIVEELTFREIGLGLDCREIAADSG